MDLIVYIETKENELPICKEMAYIDGKRDSGKKYYQVDAGKLNITNPIHPSCTCKVVVVATLDEEGNTSDFSEEAEILSEFGDEESQELANRYKQIDRNLNKSTLKMAQGQSKPSKISGWKEIVIDANVTVLNQMTKNLNGYTNEMLP